MVFVKVGNKEPSTSGWHVSAPVCKCTKSKFNIINACSCSFGNKVLGIKAKRKLYLKNN